MPAPQRPTLLLADHLIDGTGAEPQERAAVLLNDGRIEATLPQSDLTPTQRQDRVALDLEGCTLLPGLIDSHVHTTFSAGPTHEEVCRQIVEESDATLALRGLANAQAHLASGVTTIRDVGGRGWVTLALRDAIRAGLARGPRMQASGPAITTSRGHLHYLGAVASNEAEVRRLAEEALERGADLVKICATGGIMTAGSDPLHCQYTEDELRAAVAAAESRKRIVAAHVLAREALGRCVRAGVRSIEHCMFQTAPGAYDFDPSLAAEMKQRGVIAGLTFAGLGRARYVEQVLGQSGGDLGAWRGRMEGRYETERALIASGVQWVLHSDSGVRETPFGSFWLTVASAGYELGISPHQAIRAVTATAADLLGIGGETGTLEPGKAADLLVVEGDAAQDLRALARPRLVLLGGLLVARNGALSDLEGSSGRGRAS
jgi:imidazolonepropionase-like amidohydrolase